MFKYPGGWSFVLVVILASASSLLAGEAPGVSEAALKKLNPEARQALIDARITVLGAAPAPAGNPVTRDKVTLGRLLYFDTRLSADNTISCATCHGPKTGWAEAEPTSVGIKKQVGPRNAPTVLNSAYYHALFWDGRAPDLETQALGPVQNPKEMGNTIEGMIANIKQIAGYQPYFEAAFGDGTVTAQRVAQAIASFERTVVTGPSAFDNFLKGEVKALSARQIRGLELFLTRGGCVGCHHGSFLTSEEYESSHLEGDEGRYAVTRDEADKGLFRVPSLRDVARTPPYFHNGSVGNLDDAVFFRANKVDPIKAKKTPARDLVLSYAEAKDIAAFLASLNGVLPLIREPESFPK